MLKAIDQKAIETLIRAGEEFVLLSDARKAVEAERKACAKVCRDLAESAREANKLRIFGNRSAEMMQAYEYAESGILRRSNVQAQRPEAASPPKGRAGAAG